MKAKQSVLGVKLDAYKREACEIGTPHSQLSCPFFHGPHDRRRNGPLLAQLCPKGGVCLQGQECVYSHNALEQLFQPSNYKTKFCSKYPSQVHECPHGFFCGHAHTQDELRVPLLHLYSLDDDFFMFHFKTVFCPYLLFPHDQSTCLYAHSWHDFRRKHSAVAYGPEGCAQWKGGGMDGMYPSSCPAGFQCKSSHGALESEFHPLLYRSTLCPLQNCACPETCPSAHHPSQLRILSSLLTNQIFILTEKNRTFKEKPGPVQSVIYDFSTPVRPAFPPPGLADNSGGQKSLLREDTPSLDHPGLDIHKDNSNLDILQDNLYSQVSSQKKAKQVPPRRSVPRKKPLNKDSQIYFNEKLYSTSPRVFSPGRAVPPA